MNIDSLRVTALMLAFEPNETGWGEAFVNLLNIFKSTCLFKERDAKKNTRSPGSKVCLAPEIEKKEEEKKIYRKLKAKNDDKNHRTTIDTLYIVTQG